MLRMLRNGLEPKKVLEPPKEAPVASAVVPAKDLPVDLEEQHIVNLVTTAEEELQQFRSKQRAEDEEERLIRASIARLQDRSAALSEGLAVKKLLDAQLAELQLKLNSLIELKQSQPIDKTEEEFSIRQVELLKSLLKYRLEKSIKVHKVEFAQELDRILDEIKENVHKQYVQNMAENLVITVTEMIDAARLNLNAGALQVAENLLVKLDDPYDLNIIEHFVEKEMLHLTNKITDALESQVDAFILEKKQEEERMRENTKIIIRDILIEKIALMQNAVTAARQTCRGSLIDAGIYTYYRAEYYQVLLNFYEQLLASPLHKYDAVAEEIDDYERRLETLYFHSSEDSYNHFIRLQSESYADQITIPNQPAHEIMMLKIEVCAIKIMIQEMSLQLQNVKIFDVLTDSNKAELIRRRGLTYIARWLGYMIKLLNFIRVSEEADLLVAAFAKLQIEDPNDEQQRLEIKQKFSLCSSQMFLAAMQAHYAYCVLPANNKTDDFSNQMKQYRELINRTAREHEDIYRDEYEPQYEFEFNPETIEELYYLLPLLPLSPIASLPEIVEDNFEDWDEQSNTSTPAQPPPPPPIPTFSIS